MDCCSCWGASAVIPLGIKNLFHQLLRATQRSAISYHPSLRISFGRMGEEEDCFTQSPAQGNLHPWCYNDLTPLTQCNITEIIPALDLLKGLAEIGLGLQCPIPIQFSFPLLIFESCRITLQDVDNNIFLKFSAFSQISWQ